MFSLSKPYKARRVFVPEKSYTEQDVAVAEYQFSDLLVNEDGVIKNDISLLKNLESIAAKNPVAAVRIQSMFQEHVSEDSPYSSDEDRLSYMRSRYAQDPTEIADYINSLPEEVQEQLEKPADENNNPEDSDVTPKGGADTAES